VIKLFISLLSIIFILSGCSSFAVGPDYQKPKLPIPNGWKAKKSQKVVVTCRNETQKQWWKAFGDPALDQLIERALTNNLDLKIAAARVQEARANEKGAFSKLMPQIGMEGAAFRGNPGFITTNRRLDLYQGNFDASWEIDLFGGNRRKLEENKALYEASVDDQQDVLISLLAEVARNYIELRNYQTQLSLTEKNIHSAKETLDLTRSLYKAGVVSDLDALQSDSFYQTLRADVPTLHSSIEAAKNRLSTLLGESPGYVDDLLLCHDSIPVMREKIFLSLPISVVTNRPDVRAAERDLAAATAEEGVQVANMFPKITLGGLYGSQNTNLFPVTDIWGIGAGIAMPLINFGRDRATVDAARAQKERKLYQYQQTVLNALEEVENNITRYVDSNKRLLLLIRATDTNRLAWKLANERYKKGLSAFIDVLDAERVLNQSENETARARAQVAQNAVALYKSIGGF
jgi:NodT family efflux transporter outer membrane factor (OMF) lipoprotein